MAIFHDWGTHSAVTGLPSTPVFFHSSNQLRTNVQASYQRPPFGNLTNIPESRPAKLTGERKGWKIKKNRLAADEAQQEENTFELTAHNPKASGAKIPNLELTESLKDQIRSVAIGWCHSRGVVIEEEAPLPVVEYAKLLSACGYELPNTLQDGTAAQQLGANARQRRTIRRSRERAIKAIEQLKLQCSTVSNTPLKENIV